ncbi:MAG: hypothetical protein LBE27_03520 [Deltaproteobacteria bacterium]|nr:hypothetical protein [Deltaproteobacteria bacterium]
MKILYLSLFFALILLCQFNNVAFAQDEECPEEPITIGTYTGTIVWIFCSEICEISLLLDDGTVMQHPAHDDFLEFQDKPATRVKTTLVEFLTPSDAGGCRSFMLFRDVSEVSSPSDATNQINRKGEFGEDTWEYLLETANKTPEERIGITIKGFQLGMNEYSFLLAAKEHFPLVVKNDDVFKTLGFFSDENVETDVYILVDTDLKELVSDMNSNPLKSIGPSFLSGFKSAAVFKNGQLDTLMIAEVDFKRLFNISGTPGIDFLKAFVHFYNTITLSPKTIKKGITEYSYTSDDGTWTISSTYSNLLDLADDLTLKRNIRSFDPKPNFN